MWNTRHDMNKCGFDKTGEDGGAYDTEPRNGTLSDEGRRRRILPIYGCAFLSGLELSSCAFLTRSVADDYCVPNALLLH